MKLNKIFGYCVAALALLVSSSAFAQNTCESADNGKCKKETLKCDKGDDNSCQAMKAFEGLNLTDSQKEAIKKLSKQCEEQSAPAKFREGMKVRDKKDIKKEFKVKKDSLSFDRRQAMESRRVDFLKELKVILTPEQYTGFLENNFLQQGGNQKSMRPQQGPKGPQKGMDKKGPQR